MRNIYSLSLTAVVLLFFVVNARAQSCYGQSQSQSSVCHHLMELELYEESSLRIPPPPPEFNDNRDGRIPPPPPERMATPEL